MSGKARRRRKRSILDGVLLRKDRLPRPQVELLQDEALLGRQERPQVGLVLLGDDSDVGGDRQKEGKLTRTMVVVLVVFESGKNF